LQFVVTRRGKVDRIKCIRDLGYGTCDEAVVMIEKMNEMEIKWTPGEQRDLLGISYKMSSKSFTEVYCKNQSI